MENEMKSFFREKSQSYVRKSRQSNIPKVASKNITELGIIDHLKKEKTNSNQLKKLKNVKLTAHSVIAKPC